jgi:uncharacterized protein YkwD
MSRPLGLVAALLMMVAALAAPSVASAASAEDRLVLKLNAVRADHSLAPLDSAPALLSTAGRYARRLARAGRFGHSGIGVGSGFKRVGEALALQPGARPAPGRALRMLLASPPHRELLLSPGFENVGLGHAAGRFGGRASTVWVVHLGRR